MKVRLHFINRSTEAEAVRLERTGAQTPGCLAGRRTTVYATPPKFWRKVRESNPQERSRAPTVFGTARRARAQPSFELAGTLGFEPRSADLEPASLPINLTPLRDASGRTRTSKPFERAATLQAAAEPFRPLMLISYSRKKN